MIHIPVLRAGKAYTSLTTQALDDVRTGEPIAKMSLANAGLIAKDLSRSAMRRRALAERPVAELIAIAGDAARRFTKDTLPLGDGEQTPEDYVRQLSATAGLPETLVRANMAKSTYVMAEMETVLGGLTRGLDLEILDRGWGTQDGRMVSYRPETDVLAAVLPSNSPGVHSLWIPAFALKTPLALKPGSKEPWTPYRIGQALLAAGAPPEAFSFYPTDYAGAHELLLRSGRSLLFGDGATVAPWRANPGVQIHGPGWSKVVLGKDGAEDWGGDLDLIVESVAANGGRSCINASGVWTAANGRALADGLAQRLATIEARPLDDPEARLASFPSKKAAEALSRHLESQLAIEGAEDMTARYRQPGPEGRVAEAGGCAFVLPTVVFCEDPRHPLAHSEFLFPFVSVVETPEETLVSTMGESLVVTALTEDPGMIRELMNSTNVERLNLGRFPTSHVTWDQPHEGNLFEHLFRQRAFQGSSLETQTAA
ncbi:MAG: aldehyde dehydrogenase [Acidobacteriota bacterium]|nr:aldehyde dehydrogenase [Acidobacteriota bacterium]